MSPRIEASYGSTYFKRIKGATTNAAQVLKLAEEGILFYLLDHCIDVVGRGLEGCNFSAAGQKGPTI